MKLCSKCGEEKGAEGFYASGPPCKVCRRAYAKERRDAESPAERETRLAKLRASGRKWYAANKARRKEAARRWRAANAERVMDRVRAWQAANPDKVRQIGRDWEARNPEKVSDKRHRRRAQTPPSPEVQAAIKALLEEPCAYCGADEDITVDHVVPLARGGKHEADNLAAACGRCNSSKGAKLLSEWSGVAVAA